MSHRLAKHVSEEKINKLPLHKRIAVGEPVTRKPVAIQGKKKK